MALGGITVSYDGTVPPDSENAGLGAQRIRSLETTLQQVLDSEHNFAASGGANTGYHRLGSARAFFGTESTVSSSGTDGRLMVTSDTSRLFHVGSVGTMFLGGQASLLVSPSAGFSLGGQQSYWAVEVGAVALDSSGSATVAFANSGFSGVPFVFTSINKKLVGQRPFVWQTAAPTPTTATFGAWDQAANSVITQVSIFYISIGTRAL